MMPRRGLLVYLAGPMTGMRIEHVKEWRGHAMSRLEEAGFTVLDPARGLMFLEPEAVVKDAYDDEFTENRHVVFERDKFDSTRADVLFVNLKHAHRISIGTMMEMAWAHLSGRFVVTVLEKEGNPHMHAFVREASSILFDDPEEACDYIIRTFGG
jgi:nucleoside 2-deoxyribosyltransferase